ncbi:putative 2OG-Fe(II) oxygenase [Sphingomonas sp. LHG3406-1]|uniref:2OG-Fe(II) oxygenase family protein n=1 Tax=Sphingomonas sp. LHG3406-1 TaxID=2804617 RepID=UPI00261F84CE|nr:putative 2OG-Fe(II) oxygenase [Sphingomonas sp. LHG3406-1]
MTATALADRAYELLDAGREEEAIGPLLDALACDGEQAGLWQALGICLRAAERLDEAGAAFERASALAPGDRRILQGLAQCHYEAGMEAVPTFERALGMGGFDPAIGQALAAAIAAEQGPHAALERLEQLLVAQPDWLAGHWLASRLGAAAGRDDPVDRTIAAEIARRPNATHLWQHRLFTLMHSRQWDEALRVAREARHRFPNEAMFAWNEAGAATEAGEVEAAERLYQSLGGLPDVSNAIYRCRHWLRRRQPEHVAALHGQIPGPAGFEGLYPYFAIAWRMLDDVKADWLEPSALVAVHDLAGELPPLADLADHLRGLHNQVRQPLEQSVRGGTQTDGNLLLRAEPMVKALREVLARTIADHVASLPPSDAAHPQLRHRRDRPVRFSGSWSVRLQSGGHHDAHVHPEGWFSSALYVALPERMGGDDKAGWLALGAPQDSLGLDLSPVRMIEPKPGRLVLFPSTMWHGTVPFAAGERLTVAFDVKVPA